MRMMTMMAASALAAMSHALAADPRYLEEKRAEPAPPPHPYRMRPFKGRGGKKLAAGSYKGSRWAKKATRLGGNPARF